MKATQLGLGHRRSVVTMLCESGGKGLVEGLGQLGRSGKHKVKTRTVRETVGSFWHVVSRIDLSMNECKDVVVAW